MTWFGSSVRLVCCDVATQLHTASSSCFVSGVCAKFTSSAPVCDVPGSCGAGRCGTGRGGACAAVGMKGLSLLHLPSLWN